MDARLVWDTWRRILTSDQLVDRVLHPSNADLSQTVGLGAHEIAILADYASTPIATETNVGMYRRGLVRSALAALGLMPLSRHLLYSSGLDVQTVAADFVSSTGYLDDGPNLWRIAGNFVAYLMTLPTFATPSWQDVLALDAQTVALARSLGNVAIEVWPQSRAAAVSEASSGSSFAAARFVASLAAVVASSNYDLTPWIENPESFDADEDLAPATHHWLIYFPSAGTAPEYAEISERAARIFTLLSAPKTVAELLPALPGLTAPRVLKTIAALMELGVVAGADGDASSADAFVMLDPAVEAFEAAQHRMLCHDHFEMGMALPPGDGVLQCVAALMEGPIGVAALHRTFGHRLPLNEMLASLHSYGFLHVSPQAVPSMEQLAHLRSIAAQTRRKALRRTIHIDLDASASLDRIGAEARTGEAAPELSLRCVRLADHEATLAALAHLRREGGVRIHHVVVRTADLTCNEGVRRSLIRSGASVVLEGVPWPAPDRSLPGLAEMTRACVPVHALMTPDLSILSEAMRERVLEWAGSAFISGLCLWLDPDALWSASDAPEEDFAAVFDAVHALEGRFGDVCIVNLPSDEVLLGNREPGSPPLTQQSDRAGRFRRAYMRRRLSFLKSCELDNTFSQTPDTEEKVVHAQEDLIPNHPELLLLQPGSIVVDVCGGLGRVARRLGPIVGEDGLIISIEMIRCVTDRARRFACETNATNLQFRPGLAQRIPLPDGSVDAAINEWTAAIWELKLGPAMVSEMARVVRSGGRIAITHRLMRVPLTRLGQPWLQFEDIYGQMRHAVEHPDLAVVAERVWGQTASSLVGEHATKWRKLYVPAAVNPFDTIYDADDSPGPHADVFMTIVAERR